MKYIIMDEVSFELKSQQINDIIQAILRAYARYFCAIGLVTQQMRDFRGEVGEIVRNNCGSLWAFALSADEAQAFVDTFQLEPHVTSILKGLRSHDDCSEAYVQIADEGGGEFVVSGDPVFFRHIGQSQHHRAARAAMEVSA